jgi:hypothetical protein
MMDKKERDRLINDGWLIYSKDLDICPKCGGILGIAAVNTAPCNQVGEDYNFLIYCLSQKNFRCDFEEYKEFLDPNGPYRHPAKSGPCNGCK